MGVLSDSFVRPAGISHPYAHPTNRPPRLSIVVLPFANASGTPKDEELAAALTDDFMTDLDQIRGSVVVARSMAQAIAARKLPLPAVGSELAARYVLEVTSGARRKGLSSMFS